MNIESGPSILSKKREAIIDKILDWFYESQKILAHSIVEKEDNTFEITFAFPIYTKTVKPLDHVSWNLIHEAIMEWVYLAAWISATKWQLWDISPSDIKAVMSDVLLREQYTKYSKKIYITGDITYATLTFSPEPLKNIHNRFSTFCVNFSWEYCKWYLKSVLPEDIAVTKIIDKEI